MEELNRNLETQLVLANSILEWIEIALDGKELDGFALSFSIVRRVYDLHKKAQIDHECVLELGETVDRLS